MAYYSQSAINRAREMDLLTYLQTYEPDELVRISGNTYTTKTHDSLKISNGMWMWWSRGIGGRSAVDYLMRVRDMTFIEAVSQIANDESALRKQYEKPKPRTERKIPASRFCVIYCLSADSEEIPTFKSPSDAIMMRLLPPSMRCFSAI